MSSPFAHDTMMYIGLMSSYAGSAATPDDNRFFSVNLYALNAQSSELTWQATSVYLESSGPFTGPLTRVLEVSSGVYRGAVAISLAPGTEAQTSAGVDIVEYDFTMSTQASAEADTTLAIDGGALTTYDGVDLVEAGFPESPVIRLEENVSPVFPDLPMPDGTYAYQVIWEWYDARGNLHRSAPSNIASITLAAGGTSGVDVYVRCLRESLRIVSDTNVRAIVYRSEDASSGPFYRLFPRGNEYGPQAVNDPSVWEISYGDETGDDNALLALGYGSLYADTELPAIAPPPIAGFAVHKNRVWVIDAEHRKGIWYSKWLRRGFAPEFSDALRFEITDSPGEITAIASLGESLAIFTTERIYYVQGNGSNDTGAGGGFTEPITVSAEFGCTDAASVQSFSGGVLFRGSAGMYLLSPGMQLQYIGDAVKDTVAQYDQTRSVRHDIAGQRVVWLLTETFSEDSIFLIYDYFHGCWYTWEIAGSLTETCQTYWRGVHVWGGTAGTYQRGFGDNPGMDPGRLFPVMQLRTNWIQTGAISGINRCRKAYFNVRTLANVDLTVTTYHDYDETTSGQSRTWTIAANQQPTLGLRLARAKSQAYMFQFTDAEDADNTASPQGIGLVGITLELQQKRGTAKIAATYRK